MNNQEILEKAPEWATHVDVCDGWATYLASTARHWIDEDGDVYLPLNEFMDIRSLADIRRIVMLEKLNNELLQRSEAGVLQQSADGEYV